MTKTILTKATILCKCKIIVVNFGVGLIYINMNKDDLNWDATISINYGSAFIFSVKYRRMDGNPSKTVSKWAFAERDSRRRLQVVKLLQSFSHCVSIRWTSEVFKKCRQKLAATYFPPCSTISGGRNGISCWNRYAVWMKFLWVGETFSCCASHFTTWKKWKEKKRSIILLLFHWFRQWKFVWYISSSSQKCS